MTTVGDFARRAAKTTQSRRALRKTEAKVVENPKRVLFLRSASTSSVVNDALNDLGAITAPYNKKLKKRNAFHAFEGRQHLEFLGHKNDCSLFCFGSDSKKRPNNLVLGRLFDFHILDMIELGIVGMDRMDIGLVKGQTAGSIGSKPFFVFEGSEFVSEPFFVRLKNFLLDYFKGNSDPEIKMDGVDRAIFVSLRSATGDAVVPPSSDCVGTKPQAEKGNTILCFRHYAVCGIKPNSTAASMADATLADVGPNFDFEIRRVHWAPASEFKHACRVPKEVAAQAKGQHDNVRADELGNLRGQLHLGKQDISQLTLRRFKARKQPRAAPEAPAVDDSDEPQKKKRRRAHTESFASLANDTDI